MSLQLGGVDDVLMSNSPPAPALTVWKRTHKAQLLSGGPGGVYPAYLPTVGAAVLAGS